MGKPAKKAKKGGKRASARKPHILFGDAHTVAKTIAASKIYDLWVEVLGRPIKDLGDSPSDYNSPNVIAYAAFLNGTPQFKPYGLDLQQSDVVNVNTMGKLGGAIVRNFQENGWTVTPN
jgi:hypothetical protein